MRGTLLESRRRRQKGKAGVIASVGAHAALILAAVIATASATTPPEPAAPTVLIPVYRSDPVAAAPSPAAPAAPKPAAVAKPKSEPAPPLAAPETGSETTADAPVADPSAGAAASDAPSQPGAIGSGMPGTFSADQVEVAVRMSRGSAQPRYPFSLQSRGTEGSVQVEFVVDERGRADPSTLRILRTDHELFTAAIREALPRMRFQPAQVGGRAVRQLVQQTFQFRIER